MVVPRQGKEEIIDDVLDRVLYWMPFRAEDVVADVPRKSASLAVRQLTSLRARLLIPGRSRDSSSDSGLLESHIEDIPQTFCTYSVHVYAFQSLPFNSGPISEGMVRMASLMVKL